MTATVWPEPSVSGHTREASTTRCPHGTAPGYTPDGFAQALCGGGAEDGWAAAPGVSTVAATRTAGTARNHLTRRP
ncbi:hypothetical protein [Amycolatopsis magusensis]|uniref:hypothetical protein n=1 Tax=Amycolatopsis magusensis TaxID=882444 RepID=UPI0024A8ABCC|nr:hypothetical protein [Amycolatopsis magusensis]MDI5982426.1 hypothetical protein [Amycolatopsis magusensis]